jgi:hypothetical protein
MQLVREFDLARLTDDRGWPRVSMFVPTRRGIQNLDTNRITLKNQLKSAEAELVHMGLRPTQIEAVLGPTRALLEESMFWTAASDGLAVYAGLAGTRLYRLPLQLPALVAVGNRFVVWPLLPLLTTSGHYFVLTLSHFEAHLFQGTRFALGEVPLGQISLEHELRAGLRRPQAAFVGAGTGRLHRGVGGAVAPDQKILTAERFRRVDDMVREVLAADQAPLVVAGVGYLRALYERVNNYPHLLAAGVEGSPRGMTLDELRSRSWGLVEPVLRAPEIAAVSQYLRLRGTGRTLAAPADVYSAALEGRVETLFVSSDVSGWRAPDGERGAVRLAEAMTDGELVDLAALATLRNSGSVFAVAEDRMPEHSLVAAVLRF